MRKPIVGISLKLYQNEIDNARDFAHAIVEEVGNEKKSNNSCVPEWACYTQ